LSVYLCVFNPPIVDPFRGFLADETRVGRSFAVVGLAAGAFSSSIY